MWSMYTLAQTGQTPITVASRLGHRTSPFDSLFETAISAYTTDEHERSYFGVPTQERSLIDSRHTGMEFQNLQLARNGPLWQERE